MTKKLATRASRTKIAKSVHDSKPNEKFPNMTMISPLTKNQQTKHKTQNIEQHKTQQTK